MLWTRLAVLTLLAWTAAPDPDALVAQLSAAVDADREDAAGRLEELGHSALLALRRARAGADPELRKRIAGLIDLIERQRLLRATRVRLDFEDRPLAEVVETIQARTGFPFTIGPDKELAARRVTLREAEPVTLWALLDKLNASCGIAHSPDIPWSGGAVRTMSFRLGPTQGPSTPTSDAGPFRTYLVRLSRHREVTPARAPAGAKSAESLAAELLVLGEPGLALNPIGAVVLQEVVDDQGRDLRPDPPVGPAPTRRTPPRFEQGYAGIFPLSFSLRTLPGRGGRLKKLKGYVPVSVTARTGDPIIVPLRDGQDQAVTAGGLTLGVVEPRREGQTLTFTISISGHGDDESAVRRAGEFRPPYRLEDRVLIQDETGKTLWWNASPTREPKRNPAGTTISVTEGQGATAAWLLYYGLVGAVTELAFEFSDVAMP